MLLRIDTEPEYGTSYEELAGLAAVAEELGFDGFFCADHYGSAMPAYRPPGPVDAWTTLAGLARDTASIRLGTLVSPITFRLPGSLAVIVAQVDAMSGGRVELGLGTGHLQDEHRAYGIPFPPISERYDRLEEQLEILAGMWSTPADEVFTYEGRYYQLVDNPARPRPVQQPRPPIILGGRGPKRTPALAATFADEFNVSYQSPEETIVTFEHVRRACRAIGRNPSTLRFSTNQLLACGTSGTDVERRLSRVPYLPSRAVLDHAAVGDPVTVADRMCGYVDAGAEVVYFHCWDASDTDQLRLVADQVVPRLR
jgi:F420-dependent oxidoreductase-like protein